MRGVGPKVPEHQLGIDERTAPDAPPKTAAESEAPTEGEVKRRHPLFRLLQLASIAAVASLLALLIWRVAVSGGGTELVGQIAAGKRPQAPQFDLPVLWSHSETWPVALRQALSDGRIRLGELRGYPVVINFWASWCVPCKREARRFVAAAHRYSGRVAFLGIDIQDFSGDARGFLRRYHTNYVSVRNGDGSISSRYGLTGIPETYFLDRRGRILVHEIGEVNDAKIEAGVTAASQSR